MDVTYNPPDAINKLTNQRHHITLLLRQSPSKNFPRRKKKGAPEDAPRRTKIKKNRMRLHLILQHSL